MARRTLTNKEVTVNISGIIKKTEKTCMIIEWQYQRKGMTLEKDKRKTQDKRNVEY